MWSTSIESVETLEPYPKPCAHEPNPSRYVHEMHYDPDNLNLLERYPQLGESVNLLQHFFSS